MDFCPSNFHPQTSVLCPTVLHPTSCCTPILRPIILKYYALQSYVLPFCHPAILCDVRIFKTVHCVRLFVTSALYRYKILGHGTTPCPRMMRALPLIQSQGINYEVTHIPLNQYL